MAFSKKPVYKDGEYFISARPILENTDCDLAVNQETGEISVKKVFLKVSAHIGENKYSVNGKEIVLPGAPFVSDGEIYLPLSFFDNCMGFKVEKRNDLNLARIFS